MEPLRKERFLSYANVFGLPLISGLTEQGDMLQIRGCLQASVGQAGDHHFSDARAHDDDFVAQGFEPSSAAHDLQTGSRLANDDLN